MSFLPAIIPALPAGLEFTNGGGAVAELDDAALTALEEELKKNNEATLTFLDGVTPIGVYTNRGGSVQDDADADAEVEESFNDVSLDNMNDSIDMIEDESD
eukprot:CFRG3446T1